MCIHVKMRQEDKKKWLDDKNTSTHFIAYKIVERYPHRDKIRYAPIFWRRDECFEKHNKISAELKQILKVSHEDGVRLKGSYRGSLHVPYYHLCPSLKEAKKYLSDVSRWLEKHYSSGRYVIIKCRVPKNKVTDIGWQNIRQPSKLYGFSDDVEILTVVTTEFQILSEVKKG